MSLTTNRPELKPWVISPECRSQIDQLKRTSDWLRKPSNPDELEPYRRKYVAARDCKIIAAADTMQQLYNLLDAEPSGTCLPVFTADASVSSQHEILGIQFAQFDLQTHFESADEG